MRARGWVLAAVLGALLSHSARGAPAAVDLNTAPAQELVGLPGIGPKKAEAIIALRQRRPFTRVTQLLEVRGIGKKTLERLKPMVKVGAPVVGAPAGGGLTAPVPGVKAQGPGAGVSAPTAP